MQKKYYELQLKINPDMEDIISEICFEVFPCEGVVLAEETYKDLEMVSTTEGTLRIFLTDYTNVEPILKEQREILKQRGLTDKELGSWEYSLEEKENEDWSKKWKEKWDITHVTDRITVVPDWLEYEPKRNDEVIIRLEPGCAFGTGTHQTTQLCMRALGKYLKPDMTVADIGMGSGILSVCAIKMGAKSAYGCDIDETVIDVAKDNAVKNGIRIVNDPTRKSKIFTLPQGEGNSYSPLEGESKAMLSVGGNTQYAQHNFPIQNQRLAKYMRNNPTDAEYKLWYYLKNRGICGVKFRRQQPIGDYIADFAAMQEKIIIELDGGQHNGPDNIEKDKIRDKFLLDSGYTVLRFWNNDIFNNINSVLNFIHAVIDDPTRKSKIFTLPQGEGNSYSPLEGESKAMLSVGGNYNGCYFELGTADKIEQKFDFVMANILHNVLYEIMGDLKNLLNENGILSLSGILDEKKQVVLDAIKRENLSIIEEMHQDQWVGFVVTKKEKAYNV